MGGQRRYTAETLRRLEVLDVAKRAGFSLDEARGLISTGEGVPPAGKQLRDLARHKLPEIEALLTRTHAMREWLSKASGCDCETLDVCALFE